MDRFEPEEDCSFVCPYCSSTISVRVDLTAGQRQHFVYDCEVCCKPMSIYLEQSEDGSFIVEARQES